MFFLQIFHNKYLHYKKKPYLAPSSLSNFFKMRLLWLFLVFSLSLLQKTEAGNTVPVRLTGRASYYGDFFHGRRTASGERFDMYKYTAAHRTLPFGTKVKVTNLRNRKSVILKINDRGPHVRSRIIDLSKAAARAIDLMRFGAAKVAIEVLKNSSALSLGPVKPLAESGELLNTALYLPGNIYNFWGQQRNPGGFGFQVGVFTDLVSAREACQALLLKGQDDVFLQVALSGSGKLYRVMLRQFPSRKTAEEELTCLNEIGMNGFIRAY